MRFRRQGYSRLSSTTESKSIVDHIERCQRYEEGEREVEDKDSLSLGVDDVGPVQDPVGIHPSLVERHNRKQQLGEGSAGRNCEGGAFRHQLVRGDVDLCSSRHVGRGGANAGQDCEVLNDWLEEEVEVADWEIPQVSQGEVTNQPECGNEGERKV